MSSEEMRRSNWKTEIRERHFCKQMRSREGGLDITMLGQVVPERNYLGKDKSRNYKETMAGFVDERLLSDNLRGSLT
jgi:hypothetical protein